MIVPCIVNSWLYASGPTRSSFGWASWARITSASRPAMKKKTNDVTM